MLDDNESLIACFELLARGSEALGRMSDPRLFRFRAERLEELVMHTINLDYEALTETVTELERLAKAWNKMEEVATAKLPTAPLVTERNHLH